MLCREGNENPKTPSVLGQVETVVNTSLKHENLGYVLPIA